VFDNSLSGSNSRMGITYNSGLIFNTSSGITNTKNFVTSVLSIKDGSVTSGSSSSAAATVNGASTVIAPEINYIEIGSTINGGAQINGYIKKLVIYPKYFNENVVNTLRTQV
jgi:hypothetical protein